MKNRTWAALRGLTIASIKMYFRNRTGIFFSLFFPIVFIVVFGLIFKNSSTSFKIDLTNQSRSPLATHLETQLKNIPAFKVQNVSADQANNDLNKGNTDLSVTIPSSFGQPAGHAIAPSKVQAHYNADR